ncbi:MAG: cell envelope protein SmpA [Gallionellales bacterium RIFOXYB12_FULL_54_9]|nr:MAG: cell envelope protein SmpA [Gallionellales bacterium RIFOXYB12_FULL_54_9]
MHFKIILLSLLLASCGNISIPDVVPVPTPYKMDIRQGNFVTAEMREKIKLGMSKSQVKYVLGTPMVSDVFHANRWDYVYRLEQRAKLVEQQRLTLYFENDTLTKIDDSQLTVKPEPVAVEAK